MERLHEARRSHPGCDRTQRCPRALDELQGKAGGPPLAVGETIQIGGHLHERNAGMQKRHVYRRYRIVRRVQAHEIGEHVGRPAGRDPPRALGGDEWTVPGEVGPVVVLRVSGPDDECVTATGLDTGPDRCLEIFRSRFLPAASCG